MNRLLDWLDRRTGCKAITHEALYEKVPGGARWRYVWGSTLTFAFFIQVVTGIALWMAYNPSSQTAWESVYFIQNEMRGGWLLRGLHHFTAQAMNVLLILHLMQVLIDGAYRAPREINFWTGLVMLQLVLALSLTGYLLPWDQKGYWATKVTTSLMSLVPIIGPAIQKIVVGGPDYGHHTLARFFALHAGVLPGLMVLLIVGHIFLFRKHGLTPKLPLQGPDQAFWPDQLLKDVVACLAVLAAVLFLIVQPRLFNAGAPLGAELGAPADPSDAYSAARPEWYFFFLFQFLKYFPGEAEIWGAIIIPGLILLVIALMPLIGRWNLGHRFNIGFVIVLIGGAGVLTVLAMREDRTNANYQAAVRQAGQNAERVKVLAGGPSGIPSGGALELLGSDPLTQGPKLFAKNCASCHRFGGHDGLGGQPSEPPKASDLQGFASRAWLTGLLDPKRIDSAHYFGATKFKEGKMVKWVHKNIAKFDDDQLAKLKKAVAALSAQAQLKSQQHLEARQAALIAEGQKLIANDLGCTDCHEYLKKDEEATAPRLTGYGSREWLMEFISDPAHPQFYGKRNDRMPAFREQGMLDEKSIALLADWLRGDWTDDTLW